MTYLSTAHTVIYRIDAEDNIIWVNDDWLAFARDNEGRHLAPEKVLGQSLWNFVTDPETIQLYQMILAKVRAQSAPAQFPLRCDAPNCRRFLAMHILPLVDGQVEFQSRLVREEPRPPSQFLNPSINRSNEFLTVCSWCKRVQVDPLIWVEVEEAIERLDLFGAAILPNITHGICPTCRAEVNRLLADS